jgi:peptidoglycan/xylan/chitin deacetylase (PgdA/CDA1 family)
VTHAAGGTQLSPGSKLALSGTFAVLASLLAPLGVSAVRAAAPTVVSLTFDDGRATAYAARPILAAHGMHATFYVNSPRLYVASPRLGGFYMTWQQVQNLYTDGNEIGGHTAYHADLTQVDPVEAQREICYDRVNLLNHGYPATDFTFPYGSYSPSIESMVQACGYNSARTTDQLTAFAETIPPAQPYAVQSVAGSGSSVLPALRAVVTNAERNGGGWLPIVFHDLCDDCSSDSITTADFRTFLDWLQGEAVNGVIVQTVQQVIGGPVRPAVQGPPLPAAPNGTNGVRNASLELDADAANCWVFGNSGQSTSTWTRTTDAHTGTYAERVDVSDYSRGDVTLMVQQDLGSCTPSAVPGHQYRLTAWYKSSMPVVFTAVSRDDQWAFSDWATSSRFPASAVWRQASWVTPLIPADVNGLSFGLTADRNGALTIDDIGMDDAASTGPPDTTPPAVALTSPTGGASVSGVVQISATATDNVAVDHVDFLVDGSVVGSEVSAPTTFSWNSQSVANGSHLFAARAVDTAGNVSVSTSVTAVTTNQVADLLQNPSLETAVGSTPSCWQLGGYGTNTYTWTRTTDAHSGSFAERVSISSYTSGDRKMVSSQDSGTCAPAVTAGRTYTTTAWYKSTVQPYIFVYYRNGAGTWVYWSQSPKLAVASSWTQATWTTPAVPSDATNISVGMGISGVGSITMDDLGWLDLLPEPTPVVFAGIYLLVFAGIFLVVVVVIASRRQPRAIRH